MRKDGPTVDLEVYAFLTTTPNSLVATVNHERMPLLLTREEEFATWLSGSPNEALALAREYPPGQMRIVQEGFKKEDQLDIAAWAGADAKRAASRPAAHPASDQRPRR